MTLFLAILLGLTAAFALSARRDRNAAERAAQFALDAANLAHESEKSAGRIANINARWS